MAGEQNTHGDVYGNKVLATKGANLLKMQRMKLLVSQGGIAGVHTATLDLPAGCTIHDIIVHAVALWNAGTSATLKIGDAADDDGFFTGVNMKATDLTAGQSINFYAAGGKQGADIEDVATPGSQISRRYLATARVLKAILTLVGTAATTGETWIDVIYSEPVDSHVIIGSYVAT